MRLTQRKARAWSWPTPSMRWSTWKTSDAWPLKHIAENVAEIRGRMAAAAARAGRPAEDVRLVAVTKYVGLDEIRALVAAGCTDLGESRPQQLWDRAAELRDLPVRWHMIGHIQRNKVERHSAAGGDDPFAWTVSAWPKPSTRQPERWIDKCRSCWK